MHWRLNDLDRDTWDLAVRDAPFEQSWAYGATAAAFGARVERWRLVSGGHSVALAQGIRRGIGPLGCTYMPRGIHCCGAPDIDALRRAMGRGRVLLSPDAGRILRRMPDRAELVLGPGLRDGLTKKWRNRLKAAERSNVTVRRIDGASDWLARADILQARRRGYRPVPALWADRLAALHPQAIETYIAWAEGRRIAGMSFLRHGRQLRYHSGVTTDLGRTLSAHNLVLWHAMTRAQDRGDLRLDLGLVDRTRLAGLTRFKLGTGAHIVAGRDLRLLMPWAQASDGSHKTMAGKATSVAMVRASATKKGMTPLKTS